MPDWKARVAAAFAERHVVPDADVVDELAQHAAAAFEAARADGAPDRDAADRVDRLVGTWCDDPAVALKRPKRRLAVSPPSHDRNPWSGLGRDVLYAVRLLRRQPGFAAIAILTMALGIGSTTTLFGIAYGVLMKPLPWPDSDRLVRITETRKEKEPRVRGTMSNGPYREWAAAHETVESIGGWINLSQSMLAIGTGEPAQVQTVSVTPSIFTVLKALPLIGRLLVDDDFAQNADGSQTRRAILLSYGLWQEQFGGSADVAGRVVQLNGKSITVAGVMPREFVFPDRETRAWTPWLPPPVRLPNGGQAMTICSALARLRPGITPEQATAEGTSRARGAPDPGLTAVALFGGNGPAEIQAIPAVEQMTADVRPALLVLLAAVELLLVTATANVASLQLARAVARRREIAIRAAIGAGVARLTRQLLVESALVGIAGGAAGVALAVALHRALPAVLPADFPRVVDAIGVDWRVLLFAAGLACVASVVCGLAPAWQARRVNLVEALSEDGSAPVGHGVRVRTARARALVMVGQIAVSCVLLAGAALLVRSFMALLRADRGYDANNVLTARVSFPQDYALERRLALVERVADRLRGQPGVREAAYGNALPLLTAGGFHGFKMRPPADPSIEVEVNVIQRVVSPEYANALGLRLEAGRALTRADTASAPGVVLVNRSFAAKYLGAHPLGASIPNLGMCRGDADSWEVVGVVDDMRQGAVSDPLQPELFLQARQIGCANAISQAIFVVRTAGEPGPYAATLRNLVREQERTLAVDSVMTMEERVMKTLAKPRLYAVVLAGFALFAVAIAGVGLFGVLSYSVAQRSREIGVRTALGARPSDIVGLVVRQVAIVSAAGIAVGLAAAFAASRWLTAVLYGVAPNDPLSFVAVSAILLAVAAAAAIVPARRAARVDPLQVLR